MKWHFTLGLFLLMLTSFSAQGQLSCQYRLDLFDSFGDGWNGSTLTININGTNTVYTLNNFDDDGIFRSFPITITSGDVVSFTYSPGVFENEVTYFFYDADNILLFNDGPNPSIGEVFNATLTCPSCPAVPPSSVSVDDVRAFRADISWLFSDPDGVYVIEYDTTGFSPGTGATTMVNDNEVRLNGLQEHTAYDFYITVLCANGDTSTTIGPFSFMTFWANDTGVSDISAPQTACGLGFEQLTVTLRNYGGSAQSLIPFQFSINGDLIPVGQPLDGFFTGVLGKDSIYTIEFDTPYDFSEPGEYEILSWTELSGDSDNSNDTTRILVTSVPIISEFPHYNNYEDGKGGWRVGQESVNSTWDFGTPASADLPAAASGLNAWVTNLTGDHNDSELSYLVSPCYDFSNMTEDPRLSFSLFFDSEACCDEGWVELRLHPDSAWTKVGTSGTGLNWYNDAGNQWWDGTGGFTGWVTAYNTLTGVAGFSNVNIRFVFSTDFSVVNKGMAVDNIFISAPLANDLGAVTANHTATAICGDAQDQVSITVNNFGTATQSGFDVSYQVNGGPVVTETVAASLAANQQLTYTFTVPFNSAGPDNVYEIVVWTSFPDDFALNDTTSFVFSTSAQLPLVEDFETGAIPVGWTTDEFFSVYAPFSHNNPTFNVADNLYAGDPSYVLTSTVYGPVETGDSLLFDYRLTLWFAGTQPFFPGAGDKIEVFISTDCGANYSLLHAIDASTHIPSAEFFTVRLSLDAYAGETIRLRFNGTWGTGDYWFDLDNINLKRCPASLGLTANVTGATSEAAADGRITITATSGLAPYTYLWESDGNSGDNLENLAIGDYSITVTDKAGCSDVIEATVDIAVATSEPNSLISDLRLAPNPTSGDALLHVVFRETTDARITLLNNVGQVLFETRDQNVREGNYRLDLSNLDGGLYLVRIVAGGKVHTEKLVKMH
ncbi:MAG: T9SS type A sorting domain-containing protein [Saprospiraceae bacterium]|nr:T9SS type A sorting domain-containing protein [Saprospiraceae bacterium]